MVDQVSIFSKKANRENLFLRREIFLKDQETEKLEMRKMDRLKSENVALRRDNERLLLEMDELDQADS